MQPRMTKPELELYSRVISTARNYLEFGSGGSTCYAASRVAERIVTLDSSAEWLNDVAEWCRTAGGLQPRTIFVDIGPTGAWGVPTDKASQFRWPDYHSHVWATEDANSFDTFLVDGRFRVACFMQTVLRAKPGSTIMFHDFTNREHYHVVLPFVQAVETAGTLGVFRVTAEFDRMAAQKVWQKHMFIHA